MAALPNCQEAVEQHKSLYFHWIKQHMTRIRHAQELAERMFNRKHIIQQAGAPLGQEGISMSGSAAVAEGPSPYSAPGIAMPFDGVNTQDAPQGLDTRGFKRAMEYSEVEDSPT
eukprot:6826470-Karenia_brevis.AAC.1